MNLRFGVLPAAFFLFSFFTSPAYTQHDTLNYKNFDAKLAEIKDNPARINAYYKVARECLPDWNAYAMDSSGSVEYFAALAYAHPGEGLDIITRGVNEIPDDPQLNALLLDYYAWSIDSITLGSGHWKRKQQYDKTLRLIKESGRDDLLPGVSQTWEKVEISLPNFEKRVGFKLDSEEAINKAAQLYLEDWKVKRKERFGNPLYYDDIDLEVMLWLKYDSPYTRQVIEIQAGRWIHNIGTANIAAYLLKEALKLSPNNPEILNALDNISKSIKD